MILTCQKYLFMKNGFSDSVFLAGSIYTPKISLQIPSKAAFGYPTDMFFSFDRKMSILRAHFFYGPKNTIFLGLASRFFS